MNFWGPLFQCHVEIAGKLPALLRVMDFIYLGYVVNHQWWSLFYPKDRVGLDPDSKKVEVILTTNWDDPPSCWRFVADRGSALTSQPIHYESLKGLYVHIQVGQMHLEIRDDGWTTNGRENECYTRRNQHHESYYNAKTTMNAPKYILLKIRWCSPIAMVLFGGTFHSFYWLIHDGTLIMAYERSV